MLLQKEEEQGMTHEACSMAEQMAGELGDDVFSDLIAIA